jgi:hypothetical protein
MEEHHLLEQHHTVCRSLVTAIMLASVTTSMSY